jgi:hypothetical protein
MVPFRTVSSRILGVVLLLVVLRSVIFVFCEQAHFDSDQAVYGLMTKHLAEGRAFPLFMYGQKYLLAVSVYLAAPFIWAFGPSVAALKVVLLVVNLVVAVLLFLLLRREAALPPVAASVAMVFFVVPPVVTSSRLVEFQGATIEPFLWILFLWLARSSPVLLGVVGAVGVLNREFVAYGLAALLILDGRARRGTLISAPVFAATTLMVRWVARTFSSNYFGAGTPFGWHLDPARLGWLFTENLPDMFGMRRIPWRTSTSGLASVKDRGFQESPLCVLLPWLSGDSCGRRRRARLARVPFPSTFAWSAFSPWEPTSALRRPSRIGCSSGTTCWRFCCPVASLRSTSPGKPGAC